MPTRGSADILFIKLNPRASTVIHPTGDIRVGNISKLPRAYGPVPVSTDAFVNIPRRPGRAAVGAPDPCSGAVPTVTKHRASPTPVDHESVSYTYFDGGPPGVNCGDVRGGGGVTRDAAIAASPSI